MKIRQPHILIIDDDRSVNRALSLVLSKDFQTITTASAKEGLELAREDSPFLAMVDLKMQDANGIEVLKELKRIDEEIKVMIMTAYGEVKTVIEAFKLGAVDFLTKPFDNKSLLDNVRRLAALTSFDTDIFSSGLKEVVIGESSAMKFVWHLAERFAPSDIPILLQGETGTGKELFAKVIHSMSLRSNGPFVAIDCSTLPASLIESELFGYEKGAFTGAVNSKEGLLESANGGTLFLDEIGNLPMSIQAKLLRVTQEHSIMHLGSRGYDPIPLNIRIIAATNVDLVDAFQKGLFRQDLYYRISVASIRLPPLRERDGDIPMLVHYFLEKCNREYNKSIAITDEAMALLDNYHWPGNIREMENVVRSSFIIADDCIRPCHLSISRDKHIVSETRELYCTDPMDIKSIKNIAAEGAERQAILQIITKYPFISKTDIARLLKIDPKTLRSRLKRYGL
ncbi:MAG TPA: sigma-54 dependent transcriptional regulator [Thermodesulfovibrionales bacterium]|nr:sigma-54 dependent transcriptional regulator [Thermodesulfovibrionales bacterium]